MRVAIFGTSKNIYATTRIINELKNQNISFDFFSHENIIYTHDTILHDGKKIDFSRYSIAAFRTLGYTNNTVPTTFRMENEALILRTELEKHHVPYINNAILTRYPLYNKFTQSQIFRNHNIPTPRTFHFVDNNIHNITAFMKQAGFSFPIVIKRSSGSRGASVFLAHSKEDLQRILFYRTENFILQEYIKNTEDYRVFFINGKSVGIMKRIGNNDWRNNFSLGGTVFSHTDPAMSQFTEKICRDLGYDNAGVDIVIHNGQFLILEINLTPGFEGFEKSTNINIGKEFVDMLRNKSR